ncbi:helix-turn-helix transcriptional regulator [Hymenobacter koreensis]|uniref:HTH cro/C1-type domain-containing protein n=1 Tax=Hymenobacter koreensis TaxID=1084523 RepID=A0ABP8JMZ6_9BACT
MDTTFASRVKQFREFKGLAQQAFAERCQLTQGNVSQMEQGTEPKQSNVAKIISGFPDLNPDWLLLGKGNMLRDGRNLSVAEEPKAGFSARAVSPAELESLYPAELFGQRDVAGAEPARSHGATVAQLQQTLRIQAQESARLIARLEKDNDRLMTLVESLNNQLAELRLQGKTDGNQVDAPGTDALPRNEIKGFTSVRAMWPNGVPRESSAQAA